MQYSANDIADFEAHISRLLAGRCEEDRRSLNSFLRANPGMTVRDWKGKGPVVPPDPASWEKSWRQVKAQARREAVNQFARELPRNLRQAAARDPALIWNPLARKYRLRLPSDPQPP